MTELRSSLAGICAITVTPFGSDLAVDEAGLRKIVAQVDEGADSIAACGGLAEYYALSASERRLVADVTVAAARRAPVIVAVGLGIENAIEEARHAELAGAAGIMIHPPPQPYTHPDGLARYYRAICSSVDIAAVGYIRDPALTADDLRELITIENLAGIKYAVNDIRAFAGIVDDLRGVRDIAWVCGTAEAWAPFFWLAGAVGYTSGIANFAIRESAMLRDALGRSDGPAIRAAWGRLRLLEDLRSSAREANSIAVVKAATELCGFGLRTVRPPLRSLPDDDVARLSALLADWDIPALAALPR
ncbi:MAG TPA: dihydrodipicolinate synthase family protein [Streptosporangiaceae bacterium]